MGMNIGVFGLDQIEKQLAGGLAQYAERVDALVQGAGIACEKYAKQLCPVDTGRLRSSIQYVNTGFQQCLVDTDVTYGIFVELGHATRGGGGYVPPNPFLEPAYEQAKGELIDKLKALRWQ